MVLFVWNTYRGQEVRKGTFKGRKKEHHDSEGKEGIIEQEELNVDASGKTKWRRDYREVQLTLKIF